MKKVAHNFVLKHVPDSEINEYAQRFLLAPDTITRYLYARDFHLAKAFDMYSKSMVKSKDLY
jgi:hypothetical protein